MDFTYKQAAHRRKIDYPNLTDECTKHTLAIEADVDDREDIVALLEPLFMIYGAPGVVRMDNGTEITSNPVADWCQASPTGIVLI